MTKWKQQIDEDLGREQKFHRQLEAQILQRAHAPREKPKKRVVATVLGVCVVALLLILTMPQNSQVPQQQADVLLIQDKLAQDFDVFYINHMSSKNDQFLARPSGFAYGTERYSGLDHVQMMSSVLRSAVLAEEVHGARSRDMIVKFDNGERLKMKLYNHDTWLGLYDVDTKLYYVAEGSTAEQLIDIAFGARFNTFQMLFLVVAVQLLFVLLPRKLQVQEKWVNKTGGAILIAAIPLTFILPMWNIILSPWLPMLVLGCYYSWRAYQGKRARAARNVVQLIWLYAVLLPLVWMIGIAIF